MMHPSYISLLDRPLDQQQCDGVGNAPVRPRLGQVGYRRNYGDIDRYWSEWSNGFSFVNKYVASPTPFAGVLTDYTAAYDQACNCLKLNYGGTNLDNVPGVGGWTGRATSFFGEATFGNSNDIPGTLSLPATYYWLSYKPAQTGGFVLGPPNLGGYTRNLGITSLPNFLQLILCVYAIGRRDDVGSYQV